MKEISNSEFLKKFYDSKESDNIISTNKREPELVELINIIDPDFGQNLVKAHKRFSDYKGKGEIAVTEGRAKTKK